MQQIISAYGMDDALLMGVPHNEAEVTKENLEKFFATVDPDGSSKNVKESGGVTRAVKEFNKDVKSNIGKFVKMYGRRPIVCRRNMTCGLSYPPEPLRSPGAGTPMSGRDLAHLIANIVIENPSDVFVGDREGFLLGECNRAEAQILNPFLKMLENGDVLPGVKAVMDVDERFRKSCTNQELAEKAVVHLWAPVCKRARKEFIHPLKAMSLQGFTKSKEDALQRFTEYCAASDLDQAKQDLVNWGHRKELMFDNCFSQIQLYVLGGIMLLVVVLAVFFFVGVIKVGPVKLFFFLFVVLTAVPAAFFYIPGAVTAVLQVASALSGIMGPLREFVSYAASTACDKHTVYLE